MTRELVKLQRQHGRRASLTGALAGLFAATGRFTLLFVRDLGAMLIFFVHALLGIFHRKQPLEIAWQTLYVSAKSTGIVLLVGLFTGMVLGLQLFYTLVQFGSQSALGTAIALSLIRELGPVLTAVMVASRAGSGMAAEIGILRISEQIDALGTMGVDPVRYLVSPRLAASIIGFPILTAFFDFVGIAGGYITGVLLLGANGGAYLYRVGSSVTMHDINGGFIKSLVFAVIVSIICCFQGYFCHTRKETSGAKKIGRASCRERV
jgi:phospholipid/cholesterol/gamma-HCH transport system permease protein